MGYVKQDDARPEHPKLLEVGPLAAHLDDVAIMWCNRNRTDGFVPLRQVRRLVDWDGVYFKANGGKPRPVDPLDLAELLVGVDRWESGEGGYWVHDYLEHQSSAKEIEHQQEQSRKRQQEWRDRKRDAANNGNGDAEVAA